MQTPCKKHNRMSGLRELLVYTGLFYLKLNVIAAEGQGFFFTPSVLVAFALKVRVTDTRFYIVELTLTLILTSENPRENIIPAKITLVVQTFELTNFKVWTVLSAEDR